MSEDKMKADFDRWVFDPGSEGYPLRHTNAAWYAWKACAAIKDAEIAELNLKVATMRRSAEVHKIAEVEYICLIAARDLMIKELREVIQQMLDAQRLSTKYAPDNVEEAEKQLDRIKKAGAAAREALAKSEHHNSRTLEKMLLEARIDELAHVEFDRDIHLSREVELIGKLAELNKE